MVEGIINLIKEIFVLLNKMLSLFSENTWLKKRKYAYIEEEQLRVEAADFMKQITDRCYTLSPNYIQREYRIIDNDLCGTYITNGVVLKNGVTGIKHTLASSVKQSYENTICYGYDLLSTNPDKEIRPRLISPDGFSKVVELTLNKSLCRGEAFKEKFFFILKGSISYQRAYIISGINYHKIKMSTYDVILRFFYIYPKNVRVYKLDNTKSTYLYTIYPITPEIELYERDCVTFVDNAEVGNANLLTIYVFDRDKKGV